MPRTLVSIAPAGQKPTLKLQSAVLEATQGVSPLLVQSLLEAYRCVVCTCLAEMQPARQQALKQRPKSSLVLSAGDLFASLLLGPIEAHLPRAG